MTAKGVALSLAASCATCFAFVLHAAAPAPAAPLIVEITSPADGSRLPWNVQAPYAVTVSYDGKSTRYGELPANDVVLRTTYVANAADAAAAAAAPLPEGLVWISQSNCMGCHDFVASSAGPSLAAVGERYAHQTNAATLLADHIRNGSGGAWGAGRMPPHPDLSPAQAAAIADWILAQANDAAVHYSVGTKGSFGMSAPSEPGPQAAMVLSAFYTGPLKPGNSRAAATAVIRGGGS
jgi:cytochrome c